MDFAKRFPALRSRDFILLWIGLVLSFAGTQMQMVALNWHVYEITHSAVALGLIGLFRFLPIIFFSLLGGSFSDVHNRKVIMYVTQISMGVLSGILSLLTFAHIINVAGIYTITIFTSIAASFDSPARQAFMPRLVPKEHLTNAMSLYNIMWQIASIGGPALAGVAIATIGVGNIYMINAISYAAVVIALIFIKTSGKVTGEKTSVSLSAIWEGLSFVKHTTIIWSTMLLDFISTFFASATSLIPVFAKDILHVGPMGLGFLYAAPALGAVVAGFFMAHKGHINRPGPLLLLGVTVYAIGTVLFGVSQIFWFSLVALALVGGGDSVSTILRNTIRQLTTPDNMRGRMTAVNMIFFMGGPQLGDFEAGALAAAVGGPISVVIGGLGTLIAISGITYFIPSIRKYQHDVSSPILE